MPGRKVVVTSPSGQAQHLLDAVTKQFGPGSLIQLGDHVIEPVEVISTGSVGLDNALGIGGYPRGRVVEIYGPEGSGKTTLALHAIANAQRLRKPDGSPGLAVMIDAEHALDMEYAENLGVDTDVLLLDQPDTGEQGLEIADMCIRSGVVDIVVVDSVSALVPKAEIEGMMGDSHIGLQARLMSQALRKITPALGETKTTVIFINQLREKVGVFFGNPETTTGGKALKFYASVRLDIRKIATLAEGSAPYGQRARIKVVKNKLAPPFKQYETDIIWGSGFNLQSELIDLGVEYGAVQKSGAWYACNGTQIGQGKEKARQFLEDNREMANSLEKNLRQLMAVSGSRLVSRKSAVPSPAELVGTGSLADLVPPGINDPETQ